jgi:hypothetical protein
MLGSVTMARLRVCAPALVGAVGLGSVSASGARADLVPWEGNGHCYEARLVPSGITWQAAQNLCLADGGYLATITSAAENDFIFSLISGDPSFWYIDGAGNGEGPWVGGYQPPGSPEPAGNWLWVTGEPFTYNNWSPGEPNNVGSGEDRLVFFGLRALIGDKWNDVAAGAPEHGYILEKNACPIAVESTVWSHITARYRDATR